MPWRVSSTARTPWARQFVNWEFLESERIRIEEATEWVKTLSAENVGKPLGEVSGYHVPAEFSARLRAQARDADCTLGGFSALYNHPSCTVPLLFPAQRPPLYERIRITESTLTVLLTNGDEGCYAVIVRDYNRLNAVQHLVDLPSSHGTLQTTLSDATGLKPFLVQDFASPLYSSQAVGSQGGGNHTLGTSGDMRLQYVQEFFTSLQALLPPELRGQATPAGLQQGAWTPVTPGFKIRSAERPPKWNHAVMTRTDTNMGALIQHGRGLRNRPGERGLVGGVKPRGVTQKSELNAKLRSFSKAEAVIPYDFRDVLKGIDPKVLVREASEADWADAARAHMTLVDWEPVMPDLDAQVVGLQDTLKNAYEMRLYDSSGASSFLQNQTGEIRQVLVRNMFAGARRRGASQATRRDLQEAVRLYKANVEAFLENPRVNTLSLYDEEGEARKIEKRMLRRNKDPRFRTIIEILEAESSVSEADLWELVRLEENHAGKPVFPNQAELIKSLDWGRSRGLWIGSGGTNPTYQLP